MSDDILLSRINGETNIGVLTLNRPNKLNALTYDMLSTIKSTLESWKEDESLDLVVLNSSLSKSFCAGGDIRSIYENGINNADKSIGFFRLEYQLNNYIHNYPKTFIAIINGITMGGGLGISINGGKTIAANDLKLAMPETKIGFFPDVGASYFLNTCPTPYGKYIALTGNIIDAQTAYYAGLVQSIVEPAEIEGLPQALSALSLSEIEETFFSNQDHIPTLDSDLLYCFNYDDVNGILSALEKSSSDTCNKVYKELLTRSPLSLSIANGLFDSKPTAFSEAMEQEFAITQSFLRDKEFYEGIGALLVEKREPNWNYSHQDNMQDKKTSFFDMKNKEKLF